MSSNPFASFESDHEIRDADLGHWSRLQVAGDEFRPRDSAATKLGLTVSLSRINVLFVLIAAALVVLLGRTWFLQVPSGDAFRALAEGNRIRTYYQKATRGVIVDRDGEQLVQNVPNFSITVTASDVPSDPAARSTIIERIAQITNRSVDEITAAFDQLPESAEPAEIISRLDYDTALKAMIVLDQLPGVTVSASPIREYVGGPAFTHLTGYIGKVTDEDLSGPDGATLNLTDDIGRTGIERTWDAVLRGVGTRSYLEVDARGLTSKVLSERAGHPGATLTLTIDAGLQRVAQQSLDAMVVATRAPGGAAIVIDPRNGEVLALASSPAYDANLFTAGISADDYRTLVEDPNTPLFNRAVTGQYPSGSTIKPVIAAAALAEGVIGPSTTVNSVGGIRINQWFFPDWKAGGHGSTNVIKAIAESVNTFFYYIGGGYEDFTGLGVRLIAEYADRFGFSKPTGIDLPGEASGFLPDPDWKEEVKGERWYIGDTYHLAIGQGDLLVTPLQIAQATATIANGGTWYRPHLVLKTTDSVTGEHTALQPEVVNESVVDPGVITTVRAGMRAAVDSGSSRAMQSLPVPSAGKTGTAQFGNNQFHAWYTGFAPYDTPEVAVTVLVEAGGEGHAAALPVARDILAHYFKREQ